jgi:HEXXH motif-containing protein
MSTHDLWSAYEERITALNGWLEGALPSIWSNVLAKRGLHPSRGMTKFQITEFMLIANFVVRTLSAEDYAATCRKLQALPQLDPIETPELAGLKLLPDHQLLRSDLAQVQHPSLPGGSVTPTNVEKTAAFIPELYKALRILEFMPELRSEAFTYMSALCFVESPHLEKNGDCISTSSKLVAGLIYTSDIPAILLAEAILHEAAHLQLFCRELMSNFYLDDSLSIKTPLRTDLRPPSGLLHQVFVLKRLKKYYGHLGELKGTEVEHSRPQIAKRHKVVVREFEEGIRTLLSEIDRYSPQGQKLVRELIYD